MTSEKICAKCGGTGPFSDSLRTKDRLNRICDGCMYVQSDKLCPRCGKCGLYGKSNHTKDGLNCYCVSCARERGCLYRQNNREQVRELNRKWKYANPTKSAQYAKSNYARRIEECRQERRDYYRQNKEQMNGRVRANYYADRKKRLIKIAAWKLSNPDKVDRISEARRVRAIAAAGSATAEQIEARIDFFGGLCSYCGTKPWEHLDHAISLADGGSNWPANLRPACASCNLSKNAQSWFLVTLTSLSRKSWIVPRDWMIEREIEQYDCRANSYFGMTLQKLAERFGHEVLIQHTRERDDLDEAEQEELVVAHQIRASGGYTSWFHRQYMSGALE